MIYEIALNAITNKFQSSSRDESSARLMTNFSTSLSQRLSLAQFLRMVANRPPSFGSAGLESIFNSAAVEEAGSSGGVVNV